MLADDNIETMVLPEANHPKQYSGKKKTQNIQYICTCMHGVRDETMDHIDSKNRNLRERRASVENNFIVLSK